MNLNPFCIVLLYPLLPSFCGRERLPFLSGIGLGLLRVCCRRIGLSLTNFCCDVRSKQRNSLKVHFYFLCQFLIVDQRQFVLESSTRFHPFLISQVFDNENRRPLAVYSSIISSNSNKFENSKIVNSRLYALRHPHLARFFLIT